MKTSELIKELQDALRWNVTWNGDRDVTVKIYGKQFSSLELNAEGDNLYVEADISDSHQIFME